MFECFVLMILGMIVLMIPLFGVSTHSPIEVCFYGLGASVRKRVHHFEKQTILATNNKTYDSSRTVSPSYQYAVSSHTTILSSQRLVHHTDLTRTECAAVHLPTEASPLADCFHSNATAIIISFERHYARGSINQTQLHPGTFESPVWTRTQILPSLEKEEPRRTT